MKNHTTENATYQRGGSWLSRHSAVWIGAMICCALWGSAFPGIKIGYSLMGIAADQTAVQILYAGCRFALAGVLTILIGSLMQRKFLVPKADEIPKVLWLAMLQTVLQYFFFYIGLAHTSGVKASIIQGMNVFVALAVAGLLFRQEKITRRKVLGSLIGFLGVILVNLTGGSWEAGFHLTGEGFIFLSTVAYAFSSVFLKKFTKHHNAVMLSGYQFLFGGLLMIFGGLAAGAKLPSMTPAAAAVLVYLALVSAVAYSLWGLLLTYHPVSKVAVFGFLTPIFGVIFSALVLHESGALHAGSILALALVSLGIYIVNRDTSKLSGE